MSPLAPTSEQELLIRARLLAGQSLGELAAQASRTVPQDLKRDKGWVGQLIEWHLGASAGSKPVPDFEHLGIELKTIPISHQGTPLESTFVCVAPLIGLHGLQWQQSHICHKLKKVLWVPVEGERDIPLAERCIGNPLLWTPSEIEEQQLRHDWEELMDLIVLGHIEQITARYGEVLQLRPKGMNGQALTDAYGPNGSRIRTRPRGFYLKKHFTQALLNAYFQTN